MADRIGVGIVGAGGISREHLRAYQAWPDACRVVAVADVVEERARDLASRAGCDAWYTDYRALLARQDVQLISICTPPHLHASLTVTALEAGKHVLVEKPMAASLEECDAMIAAAERHGRLLSVVFQNRFHPDYWRMKALVDSGELGPLLFGKCETVWYRGRNYYDVPWRGTWETECGGAVINHAIHAIDALLWMMGDVASVAAEIGTLAHDIEVEDIGMAVLRFRSGALGQITGTVDGHRDYVTLEVNGEHGAVALPWQVAAKVPDAHGFPVPDPVRVERLERYARSVPVPEGSGHAAQVGDVLRALRDGGRPVVDGREGRRSIELVTALYESAVSGRRVLLPLTPADPFYTTYGLHTAMRQAGPHPPAEPPSALVEGREPPMT
ncbi:MAG: Gfo/Idh/MocA family oxidoreductase [Firmicutes bacterium]|nr:Gfo/Idh/MocA family oxidoreductase [Bacillota bacterium]